MLGPPAIEGGQCGGLVAIVIGLKDPCSQCVEVRSRHTSESTASLRKGSEWACSFGGTESIGYYSHSASVGNAKFTALRAYSANC